MKIVMRVLVLAMLALSFLSQPLPGPVPPHQSIQVS
jgi:hypothetical protein